MAEVFGVVAPNTFTGYGLIAWPDQVRQSSPSSSSSASGSFCSSVGCSDGAGGCHSLPVWGAAGVGCGLPVEQPEATMILVCGATTTQIAVLSLGAIVSATTVPMGGDTIHHAVVQHLRNHHELILPSQAVRPLHLALTGAGEGQTTEVWGRDVATGMARTVSINADDVRAAIQAPLIGLSDAIRSVLHNCPPDLVADLADRGMVLAGGSALLPGLDERLRTGTGMPVHIADQPSLSAVNGLAAMVEGQVMPLNVEVH